jgi:predicted enzyme involved in methoxymalonyl-ACP biosynthesis
MVAFVAQVLMGKGVSRLIGEFIPTAKNIPAAGFYEQLKFRKLTDTTFQADLDEIDFEFPSHLQVKTINHSFQ